jgi:ArsR family transcriptional regulator, lead/cadmium/zinc/bismuth-responsive transcriptional repressor
VKAVIRRADGPPPAKPPVLATRLSLLLCISAAGPISVSDLAAAVDQDPDTVSQTLRLLRASRTVSTQRDGRVIRYQIADPTISDLLSLAEPPAKRRSE